MTGPVPVTEGPVVDAPLERHLTDDSPEVVSLGGLSWRSAALGALAIGTLTAAMSYYHQARRRPAAPTAIWRGDHESA